MRSLRLYRRLIGVSVRGQLQYRLSVFMRSAGALLITGGEFLAIWALFARFGSLGEWSLAEVSIFYGLTNLSFGLSKLITTGFDHMGELVRSGTFDRILLRPRSTVLQLLGYEFTLRQTGRLVQAAIVLSYGLVTTGTEAMTVALILPWAVAGATSLFIALQILQACLAFRTIEALEIANVFTFGGASAASYPLAIFDRWFRRLFTLIVPLGAVSYYPALILCGARDPLGSPHWIGWLTPAAGPLFLVVAVLAWKRALRWYASTGS